MTLDDQARSLFDQARRIAEHGTLTDSGDLFYGTAQGQPFTVEHHHGSYMDTISIEGPDFEVSLVSEPGYGGSTARMYEAHVDKGEAPTDLHALLDKMEPDTPRIQSFQERQSRYAISDDHVASDWKPQEQPWEADPLMQGIDPSHYDPSSGVLGDYMT